METAQEAVVAKVESFAGNDVGLMAGRCAGKLIAMGAVTKAG